MVKKKRKNKLITGKLYWSGGDVGRPGDDLRQLANQIYSGQVSLQGNTGTQVNNTTTSTGNSTGNTGTVTSSGTGTSGGGKDSSESSSGGSVLGKVSQIGGMIGMFDSLAASASNAIDSGRAGTAGKSQVLVEGVLGGQSGNHLANMWSTGAKTADAINYVNNAGNVEFASNNSDNLIAAHSGVDTLDNLDIDTTGKEWQDFIFDPLSYVTTRWILGTRETAEQRQAKINAAINATNARQEASYANAVNNFAKTQARNVAASYRAFGGPMYGYMSDGAIAYDMARDNLMVKMLNAQNKNQAQPSLSFATGGLLSDNFTNGVTTIGAGGSHEENPLGGVPIGKAPDGRDNQVEEGEVIYKDYVFSKRLRVPKEVRTKYKLRGPKNMTFAEAFINAQKESEERENDPISKNGLDNKALVLMQAQEAVRSRGDAHRAAKGGHLYAKGSWWQKPQEVVWEEVEEDPETQAAIDSFWKDKLGDYYFDAPGVKNVYLKENDPYYNTGAQANNGTQASISGGINPLRVAPILTSAGAVFSDALGLTNKAVPLNRIPNYLEIGFSPLGDFAPEYHSDTRYAANQQAQQAAATRNAIMNTTAPNKFASLLAADYNAQNIYGNLLRDADVANYDNLLKTLTFNRATKQYNSEKGAEIAARNAAERLAYAQAKLAEDRANIDESNASMGARGQNASNLAENVAAYAREMEARRDRDVLLPSLGRGMTLDQIKAWLSPDRQRDYALAQGYTEDEIKAAGIKACGGKIKRKKRGLTY